MKDFIDIVFARDPDSPDMTFVEVEGPDGKGLGVGEWTQRCDGLLAIRLRRSDIAEPRTSIEGQRPAEPYYERTSGPMHEWFGLSYSNYLVLPRTLIQAMPTDWQREFGELLNEMRELFDTDDQYDVHKVEVDYVDCPGCDFHDDELDCDECDGGEVRRRRKVDDPLANYRRMPEDQLPWRKNA